MEPKSNSSEGRVWQILATSFREASLDSVAAWGAYVLIITRADSSLELARGLLSMLSP